MLSPDCISVGFGDGAVGSLIPDQSVAEHGDRLGKFRAALLDIRDRLVRIPLVFGPPSPF